MISTMLGIIKLAELFIALHVAKLINLSYPQLQSFTFYIFLSGLLNIMNFRETRVFWGSKPSKHMLLAIKIDSIVATTLVWKGIIIPLLPAQAITLALIYIIHSDIASYRYC